MMQCHPDVCLVAEQGQEIKSRVKLVMEQDMKNKAMMPGQDLQQVLKQVNEIRLAGQWLVSIRGPLIPLYHQC